jgi:hypothetical protein
MPTSRRGAVYKISDIARDKSGGADQPSGPTMPVVYAERDMPPDGFDEYRAGRKIGNRAFVLWADYNRERVFARVATVSAAKGEPTMYEIIGAAGESVGTLVREPAMRSRWGRTRWTATPAGGRWWWWATADRSLGG